MLGLVSSISTGGAVSLPPLSFNTAPAFYIATAGSSDSGDVGAGGFGQSSTTSFDVRLQLSAADFNEGVDAASDFTLTNVTVTNSTTGVTQVLASSVTMASVIDLSGLNLFYFFTEADGPLDDLDLSSDSGEAAAHNGTSTNTFVFNGFVSKKGFDGSIAFSEKSMNLNNS